MSKYVIVADYKNRPSYGHTETGYYLTHEMFDSIEAAREYLVKEFSYPTTPGYNYSFDIITRRMNIDISSIRIQELVDASNASDIIISKKEKFIESALPNFITSLSYESGDGASILLRYLTDEQVSMINDVVKNMARYHTFDDEPLNNVRYHMHVMKRRWRKQLAKALEKVISNEI